MINENENEHENENETTAQEFNSIDDAVESLTDSQQQTNETEQTQETQEEETQEETIITLDDGVETTLDELKKSYEQNQQYTQNVEKLETQRKEVESLRESYKESINRIKSTYDGLTRLLEGVAFAEPNPQLAHSDPASYQYQTALRNNALSQLQNVYAAKQRSDSIISSEMQEEINRYQKSETEKLLEINPTLKDKKQKEKFDKHNKQTALEFGFQEEEINQTFDHRILQLVHYARMGKIAQRNRKNAARRIAENPQKGSRAKNINIKTPKNKQAMQQLDKTGSIHSAMAVEFE